MVSNNVELKPYTTFGISAIAKKFAPFSSIEELERILKENRDERLLILGGGSNIVFTANFDGLVLRNEIKGFEVVEETEDYVIVKSGAGEIWHEFVLNCIDNGFGGIENLSLIPGSVGASPMQNIGAYGVEIKDVFVSLEAYHISSGEIQVFDKEVCAFGYRESVFKRELKDQYIITSVSYRLTKKHVVNTKYGIIEDQLKSMGISNPSIRDVSNAVIEIRSSKLPDPVKIGNAGSFFKNPIVDKSVLESIQKSHDSVPNYPAANNQVKLAAGWLIDQAGWKGRTFEGFGVHKNQALVLVNYGNCTGKQILDLSNKIIVDIEREFGVKLEREVNIL
jgi:UDP-N-acetylmuramate dehydrogenase